MKARKAFISMMVMLRKRHELKIRTGNYELTEGIGVLRQIKEFYELSTAQYEHLLELYTEAKIEEYNRKMKDLQERIDELEQQAK
tara:strand:+ start:307 stop:561 length:255 start_codon:yes stop_codon:yes gene_type:complete